MCCCKNGTVSVPLPSVPNHVHALLQGLRGRQGTPLHSAVLGRDHLGAAGYCYSAQLFSPYPQLLPRSLALAASSQDSQVAAIADVSCTVCPLQRQCHIPASHYRDLSS
jgi:hypothetical protein